MSHSEHIKAGTVTRFFYEIREGARRQGNVIFALIFRDIKSRSGQDGYGLFSLLGIMLEPAIGALVLTLFWYVLRRQEISGVHVALFVAVSYLPFSIVRRSISSVPKVIKTSRSFYAFQNIKPFDPVLARFILELTLVLVGGTVLLFGLWWFLDLAINFGELLPALGLLSMMVVFAFGLSLFIGVYGTHFPIVFKTIQFSSRGLLFLCAVLHPVDELPPEAQTFLSWNPIVHFEELLRGYLIGTKPFADASLSYISVVTISMIFLGFISYYVNRFKVIER